MKTETTQKEVKGITLIALVITIIVLLILVGVTIATLTGENGILGQAQKAKSATEIAEEKEIIEISIIQAKDLETSKSLEKDKFQEALNQNCNSNNKADIIIEDIQGYTVKFASNRYYEVDKSGNINYIENVTGEKTLTIQCVNSKDEILLEQKYTIVADRYCKLSPSIDGYEAKDERIEGETKTDVTIKLLYYLVVDDDIGLVFTGLDSNEKVTTEESEIMSYMVGDGTTTGGNGLKKKDIETIVKIPEMYKGKIVKRISYRAFSNSSNLIKLVIGRNIVTIETQAINRCNNLETIKFECGQFDFLDSFEDCNNWNKIEVNEDNQELMVKNNLLCSADGKKIILSPCIISEELFIEPTIEVIGQRAFQSRDTISKVYIPDSVTKIGSFAFRFCNGLQYIEIGKSVIADSNAFVACKNLETVHIKCESNDIWLSEPFNACTMWSKIETNSDNNSFIAVNNILYSKDCTMLIKAPNNTEEEILVNENVKTIKNRAFDGAKTITSVFIPNTVTTIETYAFRGCSNLKTVIIDSNEIVEKIQKKDSQGNLVENADTIYIKDTIQSKGIYITTMYSPVDAQDNDKAGYIKYIKNNN